MSWFDDLLDMIPKDLKRLSWLVGVLFLFIFVIAYFLIPGGSPKEVFTQDVIILLLGYVVGHPVGALLKEEPE